jgi:hypothetical protein
MLAVEQAVSEYTWRKPFQIFHGMKSGLINERDGSDAADRSIRDIRRNTGCRREESRDKAIPQK